MGKSGRPNRSEPSSTKYVDAHAKRLFQQVGWYGFLAKFSGENYSVAKSFAESFNGEWVTVGSLEFSIMQEFIS